MATFPLRAVGHHDQLTLTGHLGELATRLIVCAVALTVLFAGCLWQSRALLDVLNQPLATVSTVSRHAGRAHGAGAGARRPGAQRAGLRAALALDHAQRRRSSRGGRGRRVAGRRIARTSPIRRPRSRSRSASASRSRPRSPSPSPSRSSSVCRCCCGAGLGVRRARDRAGRQPRAVRPLLALAPLLFLAGVVFAYALVLPPAVRFLQGFNHGAFDTLVQARDYYRFELTTSARPRRHLPAAGRHARARSA